MQTVRMKSHMNWIPIGIRHEAWVLIFGGVVNDGGETDGDRPLLTRDDGTAV